MTIAVRRADILAAPRWRLLLFASLGLLLVVRLIALCFNRTDLFFDEAQYWSWSLEPAFGYYSKPPLIAWLISASTAVCGHAEYCIRSPAPILHTLTAVAIFAAGQRLYGVQTGVVAALAFATLPGISLSAGIVSTDVPLLTCWAIALYAWIELTEVSAASGLAPERQTKWWPAILLGLALGVGLNAKYAMAYFVLCAGIWIAATPARRDLLVDRRLWAALALGAALIVPNLVWNASNSFATFSHTADNAKWSGSLMHPDKGLEFFGAQFGVFGPVLFGVLLVIVVRWWRHGLSQPDRILLAFCLPILGIVTAQAFISRAHANWAAPAYISATLLVIAAMLREVDWRWLKASFWINGVVMLALLLAVGFAGRFRVPLAGDPFSRTLGWKAVADSTRAKLAEARGNGQPFAAVITDERAMTAELLYYMRGEATPVLAWTGGAKPQDHYEMKRPFMASSPQPVLLVALRRDRDKVLARFSGVTVLGEADLPAGAGQTRHVSFYRLSGFKGF